MQTGTQEAQIWVADDINGFSVALLITKSAV